MTAASYQNPAASEEHRRPAPGERSGPAPSFGHHRASWRDAAACRQADPELFFPVSKAGPALVDAIRAKAVCARCPVREACLTFALATNQEYGIWGGYDEDERRWFRRWRPEASTAAL